MNYTTDVLAVLNSAASAPNAPNAPNAPKQTLLFKTTHHSMLMLLQVPGAFHAHSGAPVYAMLAEHVLRDSGWHACVIDAIEATQRIARVRSEEEVIRGNDIKTLAYLESLIA